MHHPVFNNHYRGPDVESQLSRIITLCRFGVAAGDSAMNVDIGEPEFTELLSIIAEEAEAAGQKYDCRTEYLEADHISTLLQLKPDARAEVMSMARRLASEAAA